MSDHENGRNNDQDGASSDKTMSKSLLKPQDDSGFSWSDFVNKNFYISGGWDLSYYITTRGSENFHIYLWIAKDLSWTQDCYETAMLFGIAALVWCVVNLYHMIQDNNAEEIYMWVSVFIWLSANFVWMAGETFHGDDENVIDPSASMMESAIAWILLYHFILKPFKILKTGQYDETSSYHRAGLTPRISYFQYWRQYEHAHTLCWLGKDLSWNRKEPHFWVICLIPTLLIGADFIVVTFQTKCMMEDTVHYIAQLMWVVANMLWALGNIFIDDDDEAQNFFIMDRQARAHLRTWASWVLFAAFFPLVILYMVWIPLTYMNKFETSAADRFEVHARHEQSTSHANKQNSDTQTDDANTDKVPSKI